LSAPAPPATIPGRHQTHRRPPGPAVTVGDLLALPAWTVPGLRALVDAEPRPCQDEDPELHQPDPPAEIGPTAAQTRRARAVCAACPVRAACAAAAMTLVLVDVDGEAVVEAYAPQGVWGGLTPDEREALSGPWRELTALAGHPQPFRRRVCRRCAGPLPVDADPVRVESRTCSEVCRRAFYGAERRAAHDVWAGALGRPA